MVMHSCYVGSERVGKKNYDLVIFIDRSSVGRAPAGNRKVAGSILEPGISLLCAQESRLTLISHRGQAVYPSQRPIPTEESQTEVQKGCLVLRWQTYAGCLVHAKEQWLVLISSC